MKYTIYTRGQHDTTRPYGQIVRLGGLAPRSPNQQLWLWDDVTHAHYDGYDDRTRIHNSDRASD